MRGVARPACGFSMMLLVTIAPSSVISKNSSNSRPAAAHPLAVKTGAWQANPGKFDSRVGGARSVDGGLGHRR